MSAARDASHRQTRKRLATRQRISDAATRLFFERGFDTVTVDEIAEAADVSRMTVFNHFSRKEDMFFDLDQQGREDMLAALRERATGVSAVEALRQFVHRAIAEERLYARFFDPNSAKFLATVRASDALLARARAIREELSDTLTDALAQAAHRSPPDADANLAAALLLATWTVALTEAQRTYERHKDLDRAKQEFFRLVDQGTRGVHAALAGTPYE